MDDFAKEILPVDIEEEMKQSYLDYAMSVIVGRALPDVRDGLKPVHRRVLHAMRELGNDWNKPYKKSARVVGDTIGKYHPHGEGAVYDALVRMAQPFSMRVMLIDGQGNFGSVDGDPPAAMRYTEVRMAKVAHELLADIDKETVDFVPNYDGSEIEPSVFPTRLPNLLVNGSSGIAVGMATNIPPHNLAEVADACVAFVDDPEIGIDDIMRIMPGPDFPTAGIISGTAGIHEGYRTGRGRIYVRARADFEAVDGGSNERIVVSELPYQVNKARLLEKIAELVKEKRIEGISALRDESDKDGMRVVIELRRGENAEVMLNNLYQHTSMETVFGINLVALVDGQPRLLDIRQMIEAFVRHRREVVTRRTIFELRKARERAHVLEGLAVALANIDPVIALIRASANPAEARQRLVERDWEPGSVRAMLDRAGADTSKPDDLPGGFGLVEGEAGYVYRMSGTQAQAILDLRLHRLTALEQDKIIEEFDGLLDRIRGLLEILVNPDRLREVVRGELLEVKEQFARPRRTEIELHREGMDILHLIKPQDVVVTMSHHGYVKWQPLDDYSAQRRGGRGKTAATTKQEDFVERLFVANTHDTVLFFSSRGKVYWVRVYELPGGAHRPRQAHGEYPAARRRRADQRDPADAGARSGGLRADGHRVRGREEDVVRPLLPSSLHRAHRRRSARRRPPRGRRGHRWRLRRHARDERRQAHSLPRERRARDGPDRAGRARHPPGTRGAGHLPDDRLRGTGADRDGERLRKVHAGGRVPTAGPGRARDSSPSARARATGRWSARSWSRRVTSSC